MQMSVILICSGHRIIPWLVAEFFARGTNLQTRMINLQSVVTYSAAQICIIYDPSTDQVLYGTDKSFDDSCPGVWPTMLQSAKCGAGSRRPCPAT
jgi:hypothetical protein